MKPLIVICSQDSQFYLLLSHILEVDGFSSALASTIKEVLDFASDQPVRAVVLDCRPQNRMAAQSALLKQDGRTRKLPCIALVTAGAEKQHIHLLKSGIDECFARPIVPAKLLECLRGMLGVGPTFQTVQNKSISLRYSDVEMQVDTYRVHCNGKQILLGPIEFRLLRHMLENPEKVISRGELIEVAWPGGADVGERTVDVHISQLRKLLRHTCRSAAIRTVRQAGYALEHRSS